MRDLSERPLMCVTFALGAGIALAGSLGGGWAYGAIGVALGAVVLGAVRGRRAAVGWGILLAAAGLGGVLFSANGRNERHGRHEIARLPEGGQTIVGTVDGAARGALGTARFVLRAEAHEEGARSEPIRGRVYVRLKSEEVVRRGQRWRLTGKLRPLRGERNPGGRSEADRLASLGVSSVLSVGSPDLAELVGEGDLGPIASHAFAAQRGALDLLERYMPGPYREQTAAVAASVIFGVHSAPPPREITEIFRRAGTIHLLVVSGAIVSMVFGLVFLPGALGATWRRGLEERQQGWPVNYRGRIPFRPGLWAAIIAMLVVSYYAVLTEGGQAVARAAVMGVMAGLAIALRRVPGVAREHGLNVDHYTLLAAAALAILVVTPEALFQAGFQLSFAAVLAILYLTPKAMWLVRWLPKWVGYVVVGTFAAQLATFPILAYHYGQAPIAGFGANLLAVPLASVVLVGGMSTCALGVCLPLLAPAAGWVTAVATRGMIGSSAVFASMRWASVEVGQPGPVVIIAWFGGMVLLGRVLGRGGGERPGNHR